MGQFNVAPGDNKSEETKYTERVFSDQELDSLIENSENSVKKMEQQVNKLNESIEAYTSFIERTEREIANAENERAGEIRKLQVLNDNIKAQKENTENGIKDRDRRNKTKEGQLEK